MKKYILTASLSIFYLIANGQISDKKIQEIIAEGDEKNLISENSKLLYEGFFVQAEMIIDKLLTIQPENPNYNYRKGFLLLEMNQDYTKAIPYLEKAITKTKAVFDAFNHTEEFAPIDAFYHLGRCYHFEGNIEKAITQYNIFLNQTNAKSELISDAKNALTQCANAKEAMANPKKIELKNLGDKINTKNAEYSAVISLDGSTVYFTSKRPWKNNETQNFRDPFKGQFPEDVYASNSENNLWDQAQKLEFCKPDRNESAVGVSVDERYIYLYEDSTGSGDIYYADLYNPTFQKIEFLNIPGINSPYWETHLMKSIDGTKIFFSSDRPGGLGGRDIYLCTLTVDNKWSKPINMGPTINSAFDEDSPFISANNTLYYASNGPKSIGGFDILIAKPKSDEIWNEGVNAGYPFNSSGDDIFFSCTIDEKRGFITSSRLNGLGSTDIYEINNEQFGQVANFILKGKIKTNDGSQLPVDFAVNMELKCTNCSDNNVNVIFPRLRDGVFYANLEPCKDYILNYLSSENHKTLYTTTFNTKCNSLSEVIEKEVMLDASKSTIVPVLIYKLSGIIADGKTRVNINNASVEVYTSDGKLLETAKTDANGSFNLNFLKGKSFGEKISVQVKITANGYLIKTVNIDQKLGNDETIALEVVMDKIDIGTDLAKVYGIKSIYFDFAKSDLRPDAMIELDKVVKLMNENPTIKLEYGAHTDCKGSEVYNQYLSEQRAKSVENYIKERISNPERISGKGYGESQPAVSCNCEGGNNTCTSAQYQANRRAVFKVVQN